MGQKGNLFKTKKTKKKVIVFNLIIERDVKENRNLYYKNINCSNFNH